MAQAEVRPTPHDEPTPTRGASVGHVVSARVLVAVWGALLGMTAVTVGAASINLGTWNLFLAVGIATFKASLVLLYFMHLRYDRPINGIVFICSLLFVMLFVSLALMDTVHYQPELEAFAESPTGP